MLQFALLAARYRGSIPPGAFICGRILFFTYVTYVHNSFDRLYQALLQLHTAHVDHGDHLDSVATLEALRGIGGSIPP
jgi:hypothetical protein